MSRATVTVTRTSLGGFALHFDYDERIVNAIKSRVRPSERTFDPVTKTWVIETRAAFDAFRWATNGWIDLQAAREAS